MTGGGALIGESGGEEIVGGAAGAEGAGALRGTGGASLEAGSSAVAAGFTARVSISGPLRLPNTTVLQAGCLLCPQLFDQR
jgi:hypothetical protein